MPNLVDTQTCLTTLQATAHALSSALEESEVIKALLSQVVNALAARGALLRLLSPNGDELLSVGALGLSDAYLQKGPIKLTESQVDQRVLAGEIVVIPDVTQEPGFQYPTEAASEGLRGMVAVPMSVRDRVVGRGVKGKRNGVYGKHRRRQDGCVWGF